ncbi:MAG: flavodoxin family protein [Thaumarchaeota archaeon]|nr:flavodoxin family protein [Nitrososphaerota archaeon]
MQTSNLQRTESKTAIVVYYTQFGNTEKIARSLTAGLDKAGAKTTCVSTAGVRPDSLKDFDIIVLGAPTQAFSAAKPMKEFIESLGRVEGLSGKSFFAFDTKLPSHFSGSAAKYIESQLERMGLRVALPRSSAIGRGGEFKLDQGEEERFEKIGIELGTLLKGTE